jgi:hypothetical protein
VLLVDFPVETKFSLVGSRDGVGDYTRVDDRLLRSFSCQFGVPDLKLSTNTALQHIVCLSLLDRENIASIQTVELTGDLLKVFS